MHNNDIIIYTTEDGLSEFTLRELDGELWLTQKEIAELYQTSKQNIGKHIKAIFAEQELDDSVVNFQFTTAADGKNYRMGLYPLSLIIAVGYRVRSTRGTQFRQWAQTVPKISLNSCSTASGTSAAANGGCICVCAKYSPWRRITSPASKKPPIFSKSYKTNFITPAPAIPPLKLFTKGRMRGNPIWG